MATILVTIIGQLIFKDIEFRRLLRIFHEQIFEDELDI